MKIFAQRNPETADGMTRDRWRAAVTDEGESVDAARLYDEIKIIGTCTVVSVPDSEPSPHVFVRPDPLAVIVAYDGGKLPALLRPKSG